MTEATFSIANAITEAGATIGAAMGVAFDLMTSNALLTLFLGVGLVGLGFAFFYKAKRAVRH